MTGRQWAVLAFRTMAVWFLAGALLGAASLPYYFSPEWEQVRRFSILASLLPCVVSLVVAYCLWFNAEGLSRAAFPEDTNAAVPSAQPDQVFGIGLAIIGVFLVVEAIPLLVNGIGLFAISVHTWTSPLGQSGYSPSEREVLWGASAKASTVAAVVRLLLGVALLAGPRRLRFSALLLRDELRGTLAPESQSTSGVEQEDEAGGAR